MRKLILVCFALVMGSNSAFAQRGGPNSSKREMAKELTPTQLATLQTKKMTLALDLTLEQQTEVLKINTAEIEARRSEHAELRKMRLENDESPRSTTVKFARQNSRLDNKIARQEKMKEVLTAQQYTQWKKMNQQRERGKRPRPQ